MVGEGVLNEVLLDPSLESVIVVGRRPCNRSHPKLMEVLHTDFHEYSAIRGALRGYDACFFCLGVTSVGKSEPEYTRLTYDLTMAAARMIVEENPGSIFCYVSGAGTDSTERGRSMWARVKGKTENDLAKLPFKAVYNFRPGFIKPTPGLKNALGVSKVLAPLYPGLHFLFPKYVCTLEELGRAMIHVVNRGYEKNILECVDISRLGGI
jgi:uncharacterized protein YbjT (DUF2867 family)